MAVAIHNKGTLVVLGSTFNDIGEWGCRCGGSNCQLCDLTVANSTFVNTSTIQQSGVVPGSTS